MGYTTEFDGVFKITPKLDEETYEFLVKLNDTRRMARDLPLEYGTEGEFYVDGEGVFGQDREDNIIDFNKPPSTQPGLWCQWRPNSNREELEWDEGEKFYHYVGWLEYLIEKIFKPRGYTLNGEVCWRGEDFYDAGKIIVKDNEITTTGEFGQ